MTTAITKPAAFVPAPRPAVSRTATILASQKAGIPTNTVATKPAVSVGPNRKRWIGSPSQMSRIGTSTGWMRAGFSPSRAASGQSAPIVSMGGCGGVHAEGWAASWWLSGRTTSSMVTRSRCRSSVESVDLSPPRLPRINCRISSVARSLRRSKSLCAVSCRSTSWSRSAMSWRRRACNPRTSLTRNHKSTVTTAMWVIDATMRKTRSGESETPKRNIKMPKATPRTVAPTSNDPRRSQFRIFGRTRGQITCSVKNGKANISTWTTHSNGRRTARVLRLSPAAAHSPICTKMPQSRETTKTGADSNAPGRSLIRPGVICRSYPSSRRVPRFRRDVARGYRR